MTRLFLSIIFLATIVNASVFYYGTPEPFKELQWRYCFYEYNFQDRLYIVSSLNMTKHTKDSFLKNWINVHSTMLDIKQCARNTQYNTTQTINFLDVYCFNFVKSLYICKYNPNCIWNRFHTIQERNRILHLSNTELCAEL